MVSALEEIVQNISNQAATVTRLSSIPPSFDESSAVEIGKSSGLPSETEALLFKAKNELANSAADLLKLAQGPVDHIINLAYTVRSRIVTDMQPIQTHRWNSTST